MQVSLSPFRSMLCAFQSLKMQLPSLLDNGILQLNRNARTPKTVRSIHHSRLTMVPGPVLPSCVV